MSLQPHTNMLTSVPRRRFESRRLVSNEPAARVVSAGAWHPHPSPAFGFIVAAPISACIWALAWLLVS